MTHANKPTYITYRPCAFLLMKSFQLTSTNKTVRTTATHLQKSIGRPGKNTDI